MNLLVDVAADPAALAALQRRTDCRIEIQYGARAASVRSRAPGTNTTYVETHPDAAQAPPCRCARLRFSSSACNVRAGQRRAVSELEPVLSVESRLVHLDDPAQPDRPVDTLEQLTIPAVFLVDGDTGKILATAGDLRGDKLSKSVEAALAAKKK